MLHLMKSLFSIVVLILLLVAGTVFAGPPRYKVIFNCDGYASFINAEGDQDRWLLNVFGPLEGSQVGALFWCDGAGGNTANYKSEILEVTGTSNNNVNPHLKQMLEKGQDPPAIVVREAHARGLDVFFSFRFNDIHDRFIPEEMPTFKQNNPDWLIGELDYDGLKRGRTSLNFAVDAVRDLKFRIAEELMTKHDFDGLEIDFMRSAPYFKPDEVDSNAHLLTELLARMRKMLDGLEAQRGRDLYLAVRVDETLVACKKNGLDVPAWVEQDLVDFIALGSGVIDIDVEDFKKVAKGKKTLVYPCVYGWPSKYMPIPKQLARGMALNYHSQGADGIYTFNWFPHTGKNTEAHGPYLKELLQQVGEVSDIVRRDDSIMFVADRGVRDFSYLYNWSKAVLPSVVRSGRTLDVPVRVTLTKAITRKFSNVEVRVHSPALATSEMLTLSVGNSTVKLVSDGEWFKGILDSRDLSHGVNTVKISYEQATADSPRDLSVNAVEFELTMP